MSHLTSTRASHWVVVDNGFHLKVRASDGMSRTGENAVATYRGARASEVAVTYDEIDALYSEGGHRSLTWQRPLLRGVLADAALQAQIWEAFAGTGKLKGAAAIITAAPDSPHEAVHALVDIALYYFRFASVTVVRPQLLMLVNAYVRPQHHGVVRMPPGADAGDAPPPPTPGGGRRGGRGPARPDPPLTGVVVDIGATGTEVVAYALGRRVEGARRRVHVGGQTLTAAVMLALQKRNPTTELEPHVINALRERACEVAAPVTHATRHQFVSGVKRPRDDANTPASAPKKERRGRHRRLVYCLPDYECHDSRGYIVSPEQLARAGRDDAGQFITVMDEVHAAPELLFHPNVGGMGRHKAQGGVVDAIVEVIRAAPALYQPALWGNIVVAGGASQTKGFTERLAAELRAAAPADLDVNIVQPVPERVPTAAVDGGMCAATGLLTRVLDAYGSHFADLLPPPVAGDAWAKIRTSRQARQVVEEMWAHG